MSGGDIFCNRILSDDEIMRGLCAAFSLTPEQIWLIPHARWVELINTETLPERDDLLLCRTSLLEAGDFRFQLELGFVPVFVERHPEYFSEAQFYIAHSSVGVFCATTQCQGLTSDECINPYTWVLADERGPLFHIGLDRDLYDDDEHPGLRIDPAGAVEWGRFYLDRVFDHHIVQEALSAVLHIAPERIANDWDIFRADMRREVIIGTGPSHHPDPRYPLQGWIYRRSGVPWIPAAAAAEQWIVTMIEVCQRIGASARVTHEGLELRLPSPIVPDAVTRKAYYVLVDGSGERGRFFEWSHLPLSAPH